MSQGLSAQIFYADYVIQVTIYLLWFSIQCFLPILLFHHCFSISSLFLFHLFSSFLFYSKYYHQLYPLFYCYIYQFPSTVFLVAFIFDKYFSLRLTYSIVVGSCPWVMWLVDWDRVIKQLLSRYLSQTTKVLHRNLEKLPCLRSLRYCKNIGMCRFSVLGNCRVHHLYVEALNRLKSDRLPPLLNTLLKIEAVWCKLRKEQNPKDNFALKIFSFHPYFPTSETGKKKHFKYCW